MASVQEPAQPKEADKKGEKPAFRICVNAEGDSKKLLELGSVWKKTSKAGNVFYSGKVAQDITLTKGEYINVFPNVKA
jgi:uncharacterized protein (DUF736 family)